MSHVNFHQVTEVSKWTLLIWVLYIEVKWCWCAEMFGWHIKQKEVVEERLLREAFQWPVKGFYLTGFLIACLDFWIETVLLYPDAFNHGRKPLKIMMLCLLYQALAEKQFPTTLMDPFSIVTIAVYLNRVTCSHCHLILLFSEISLSNTKMFTKFHVYWMVTKCLAGKEHLIYFFPSLNIQKDT